MSTIQKFEDLEIWQLARVLAKDIFLLTQNGKLSKKFSLKDQMGRSSGSIMDNIAEGSGRASRLEFIQFLSISTGSADELKSQLYRCLDKEYISKDIFDTLYEKTNAIYKKINGFIKYLNTTLVKGTKFKERTAIKANGK
ncbi:MAG: four helix bundle protein [Ferruginibacter sp.]|nr:four helix bundle protein [Chitinophagaceae bacterium]MBP6286198.1 four helix bundle protein [Ferruginibacter sp.]